MLLTQLARIPGFGRLWRSFPLGSPELRTRFDIWSHPAYAYGVWRAVDLARSLGLDGITAADFRDLPYVWAEGFYRMDQAKLKHRLQHARLMLGNLASTVPDALDTLRHPIGFISFDLDYDSSTMEAFRVFDGPPDSRLPRVFCYFDDLIWPERACYSEFTGEYAAIRDFNARSKHKKISQVAGLRWMRERARAWNEQIYVLHDFEHARYSRNITPAGVEYRQLELSA